ncbi:hypothetical protein AAII07_04280 [Microvirga sp. 0TCS3.31]
MNTTIHSVRRRIAGCAVAAVVLPAFAACGADIDPPAQNINQQKDDKKSTVPDHSSGNRYKFDDEYGTRAKPKPAPNQERSLNRMDFRDNAL